MAVKNNRTETRVQFKPMFKPMLTARGSTHTLDAMPVPPLPSEDQRHVDAADGWLRLGDHLEAKEELEKVAPANRTHPEVLQALWAVNARAGKWDVCLDVASALTQIEPERRFGWLHRAQSLRRLGRTAEAKVVLLSVLGRFEPDCSFRFNLACYSAQLGQRGEARAWLQRAIEAAGDGEKLRRLRLRALDEPELATLWREISKDP